MYFTSGQDRAFERLMQEKPGFDHYDGGGANAPENCGSCRFYRPDWKYQYCVYAECPYQPGKLTALAAVKFTVKGADDDMAVFRVEKNKGYTVMSNHHLRNKALSLKAKGLLSQMASLDFSGQCSMGREDELGCLAQNLNSLSASLSTALNDLQAANEQLKADIEKEQALERQRVEFFSAASHELKTPLTILKGHLAGMLNKISGYENHTEYMERSLSVVERMEKLVEELLYVSKADGNQKSEYKTVDFAELVRVQIATVTDLLEEKKQRLEVTIPDRLSCEVEPAQMERAIQNILVNAIRYSPDGELIRVSLAKAENVVCFDVENTGVHIPEDALSHLFEAFYRTDTSRNRNTGGTGLGLYIVRKIMEMHHAEYGIKNTKSGVLFWSKLPIKQSVFNSI